MSKCKECCVNAKYLLAIGKNVRGYCKSCFKDVQLFEKREDGNFYKLEVNKNVK